MHTIQEQLLRLSKEQNLAKLSLREMAEHIGLRGESPQKIKHHLDQLQKNGLLSIDRFKGQMGRTETGWAEGLLKKAARLLIIPIVGSANCGPAEILAQENLQGYLRLSSTLVGKKSAKGLFAIRASGPSMNRTNVNGKTIDDGDYLIIDGEHRSPENGDVVLSVIDGAANIKRFVLDKKNEQVALISESTQSFAPIYISPEDDYFVNGKVVAVMKKPKTR
jgi:SOS-response transcriptional repressor LexA